MAKRMGVVAARIVLLALIAGAARGTWADDRQISFHRGAPDWPRILVVAHGGASSMAPQNTLASGLVALEIGADVWGVDVRRSRDGVFVLMHDETLTRTTNVEQVFPKRSPWRVADFTLSEIQSLDAGSWFAVEDPFGLVAKGGVSPETAASFVGEPVPTLRAALEFVAANDWRMDIEIKAPFAVAREATAAELIALVRETGTIDRVLVSSFDHDLLREVRRQEPRIAIGALTVLPMIHAVGALLALGADVYLPSMVGFTTEVLMELEEAGIRVIVWTYNSDGQLDYATSLYGVDGVYTDFPQRLIARQKEPTP